MRTITAGSRRSSLALTQSGHVIDSLKAAAEANNLRFQFDIKKIVTKGDQILNVTLSKVGGKGLFVKEIERALLDGTIDMAIHSMKDVPSVLPEGLMIAAIPEREDPRDCIVSRDNLTLKELPKGAKIGTSSLRRMAQLKRFRPDFNIEWVRGNIETRMSKIETEGFDAVVLAAAGLKRMGWEDRISDYLPVDMCIPAVGQGALAIEVREDDTELRELLAHIHHEPTARAIEAERGFLARLNGGCQVPIGGYAQIKEDGMIDFTGIVGSQDGSQILMYENSGNDPKRLGIEAAEELLAQGADRLLETI